MTVHHTYFEKNFDSFVDQENVFDQALQEYDQIEDGPFSGSVIAARLGQVMIYRETANRGLFQMYEVDRSCFSMALNMPWASPIHQPDLTVEAGQGRFRPHDGEIQMVTESGYDCTYLVAPLETFPDGSGKVPTTAFAAQNFAVWVSCLLHHVANGANNELIKLAPDLLLDNVSSQFEVINGASQPCRADLGRIWRAIRECIANAATCELSVTSLEKMLGMPKSILRDACLSAIDQRLDDFLLRIRLSRARRVLQSATVQTVTDAALDNGFLHFGRFSKTYRQTFAELPSTTLRKAQKENRVS